MNTLKEKVKYKLAPTSAIHVILLAFAAERRPAALLLQGAQRQPLSIDVSRPAGPQHTPVLCKQVPL